MPIVCVNWEDAQKYIIRLSEKTGQNYRLLTEAEWECAARAGSKTARYWGDDIGSGNASCDGCGNAWDGKRPSPVGTFKPNAFGLYDMLGNVFQWTEDGWDETYDGAPNERSARTTGYCKIRVRRDGSWGLDPGHARGATLLVRQRWPS